MQRIMLCFLCALLLLCSISTPILAADAPSDDEAVVVSESGGLFSWIGDIAQFVKRLVVPDADYFHNQLADLSAHVNDRFGGLAYLYLMLNQFFNDLKQVPNVGLKMSIPNNFFYPGYRGVTIDALSTAKPYVDFLRAFLTSSFCLLIAISCYHKLRTMFREGG